jgi:antitoxin (DNA-binding transcriptional repressor) of toxin-antitoxin stability system
MKRISLAKASRSLAEYAVELGGEVVVVTKDRRPFAVLVPLERVDREALALSSHPEFVQLVTRARRQLARGKSLSLKEVRGRVGLRAPIEKRPVVVASKRPRP